MNDPAQEMKAQIARFVMAGNAARDCGDIDEAIKSWKNALDYYELCGRTVGADLMSQVIPDEMMAAVYFDYGTLLESRGDVSGAYEATRMAARLNPSEPGFLQQLGRYCSRLGLYQECVDALQAYLKLDPDAEDSDEAQITIQANLRLQRGESTDRQAPVTGSDWWARHNAGVQLFETGDYVRAKKVFATLLKEKDLPPVDKCMCRISICQCILCARNLPSLRECFDGLSDSEHREIELQLGVIDSLKGRLTADDLDHAPVSEAFELLEAVKSLTDAAQKTRGRKSETSERSTRKTSFLSRLFGRER